MKKMASILFKLNVIFIVICVSIILIENSSQQDSGFVRKIFGCVGCGKSSKTTDVKPKRKSKKNTSYNEDRDGNFEVLTMSNNSNNNDNVSDLGFAAAVTTHANIHSHIQNNEGDTNGGGEASGTICGGGCSGG